MITFIIIFTIPFIIYYILIIIISFLDLSVDLDLLPVICHCIQYRYASMHMCCSAGGHKGLHQHDAACCLLSILVEFMGDSTDLTIIGTYS